MLSISLTVELRSTEANKLLRTLYSMTNQHRIKDFMYWLARADVDEIIIDSLEEQLLKIYERLYDSMRHSNGRVVHLKLESAERIALSTLIDNLMYKGWKSEHFPLTSTEAKELANAIRIIV